MGSTEKALRKQRQNLHEEREYRSCHALYRGHPRYKALRKAFNRAFRRDQGRVILEQIQD